MKVIRLLAVLILPLISTGQADSIQMLEKQINTVSEELKSVKNRLINLDVKLEKSEDKLINRLTDNQTSNNELLNSIASEINALMSNNELQINNLESIVDRQEREIQSLSYQVGSNYKRLMIILIVGLILLPVVSILVARASIKRALETNQGNWNKFQEYILSKK